MCQGGTVYYSRLSFEAIIELFGRNHSFLSASIISLSGFFVHLKFVSSPGSYIEVQTNNNNNNTNNTFNL